ncbi:MAG: Uma2 family endonuclease [Emticicia sp.]|nr:Uma2 family endonuclease [Emticicia sp.]
MITEIREAPKRRSRKIPSNLIREEVRGVPYYYRGYKEVVNGKKQIEEIMGSSSLQSIIVSILDFFIKSNINRKLFWIATNEAGIHLANKNNFSTDVGIFLKEKVTLNDKYFDVAPEIAIEVDVKIDSDKEFEYLFAKSEELLAFGTKKVVWIITKNKKIFVFAKDETTQIFEWDRDILLMENISLNLKNLLDEEGVVY